MDTRLKLLTDATEAIPAGLMERALEPLFDAILQDAKDAVSAALKDDPATVAARIGSMRALLGLAGKLKEQEKPRRPKSIFVDPFGAP